MKVLMTTDSVGGVWTYSLELIRGLAEYGVRVCLASMGRPLTQDQRHDVARLPDVEVFESGYRLEWMQNPWDDVKSAGQWLLRLRDRIAPDLLHLNGFVHGSLGWNAPVLVVGHSCVYSWMHAVRNGLMESEWAEYRRRVQRGLQAADLVVAPTRYMLDELKRHYGDWRRGEVIYNGQTPVKKMHATSREPFILSAGRLWDEAKNIRLLAEIADQIDWPILVAGNAEHPDGYGRVGWGNLQMLGHLPHQQLQALMNSASLYVLPARYEPFGLTPLEAAATGCPLVLGDIGTLREIWDDAAVFQSPDASQDWIDCLNALIAAPEARQRLGNQTSTRAASFSRQRMASEYYSAYRRLLQQHGQPAFHHPTKAAI